MILKMKNLMIQSKNLKINYIKRKNNNKKTKKKIQSQK